MAPSRSSPKKATPTSTPSNGKASVKPANGRDGLEGLPIPLPALGPSKSQAIAPYIKTIVLLSLLGIYSNVSQLALSPVYGSIPAAKWHSYILIAGSFLGWAGNLVLRQSLPLRTVTLLPLFALHVPTIQFFLFDFSDKLGCEWGPIVTEVLTLLPIAVLSASSVADAVEGLELSALPGFVADAAPGMVSWVLLKTVEHVSQYHIAAHIGKGFFYTRMGMELFLGASYTLVAPSKLALLALPALLHTATLNTHVLTPQATVALNTTMLAENWMLLDRKESLTGYVSVIESVERGFRVMRCDHSLLGGEWVLIQGKKVAEPIYGVFVMLEAVRLVETKEPVADKDASALLIGLGIGTTPSALVRHGIDTTVVEIDPVVHEFAAKYFDLQENNPPVLTDAAKYTADLAAAGTHSYDYIVHDVFTGGAEPLALFTLEFLQGLSALLKPEGVVAINYAGDFALPTPKLIIRAILQVFPTCRAFRESVPDEKDAGAKDDFTNMVIFCRKTTEPLTFRTPVWEDFLESRARQYFLEPKHEVSMTELLGDDSSVVLMKNNTDSMEEWHTASAVGHWAIMRTVLPPQVWQWW